MKLNKSLKEIWISQVRFTFQNWNKFILILEKKEVSNLQPWRTSSLILQSASRHWDAAQSQSSGEGTAPVGQTDEHLWVLKFST